MFLNLGNVIDITEIYYMILVAATHNSFRESIIQSDGSQLGHTVSSVIMST